MPITLIRHGSESIPLLKPLWIALHDHHVAVAPHLGTPRSHEESWNRRLGYYQTWFQEATTFAIIAYDDETAIGYALTRIRSAKSETWQGNEKLAELETLVVLPEYQGQGIGQQLVDEVVREVKEMGYAQLGLTVIASNAGSMAFYEKNGFVSREISMRKQL